VENVGREALNALAEEMAIAMRVVKVATRTIMMSLSLLFFRIII
jgi:hypothetical protein